MFPSRDNICSIDWGIGRPLQIIEYANTHSLLNVTCLFEHLSYNVYTTLKLQVHHSVYHEEYALHIAHQLVITHDAHLVLFISQSAYRTVIRDNVLIVIIIISNQLVRSTSPGSSHGIYSTQQTE